MTGIATANILNLTDGIDPNDLTGFAGDITGLTTLTLQEGSNPFGTCRLASLVLVSTLRWRPSTSMPVCFRLIWQTGGFAQLGT